MGIHAKAQSVVSTEYLQAWVFPENNTAEA
jgi:hypothetical protein